MNTLKIGFIVNPIAGMGGRVGLKGTDGSALNEAITRGAKPISPFRATKFLRRLQSLGLESSIKLFTCPGVMGEQEAKDARFPAKVLSLRTKKKTTAEDTKKAVRLMIKIPVNLIVFVGGDGTARDILDALRDVNGILVLGVPSGVKMYSGIFAASPSDAADVIEAMLKDYAQTIDLEIMDVDEEAFKRDILSVKLYGYLKGPYVPLHLVESKLVTIETQEEIENQIAVAKFITEQMDPDAVYILGPGTTVKRITEILGVKKTVLGVDVYRNGHLIKDVDDKTILYEINNAEKAWIIVSPIGRQGMLFGRGNQQISPEAIKRIGKERIIVVATKGKIQSIEGGILRVDTGDPEVDNMLRGYIKVFTDYAEWRMMPVQ